MPTPILSTKLYVPPTRPDLVARQHLRQRLNEGLRRGHKLTLVSAPAGFGKTTLLSRWSAGVEPPVAWLSLDPADDDLARFWTYAIAALQTVPALAENHVAKTLLAALQSPQPPPTESLLTALINEIATLTDPVTLVLDDYHEINAPAIHAGVAFLLEHQPPHMHLALATRKDPMLPLARLRGRGQITEIRAADLKFSPAEAATLYNQVAGLDLNADEVRLLEARTEGWAAGLQMAAFSLQGQADRAAFIRAFAGDDRQVMDYLVDEVLNRQPDDVRDFMLRTSILDRLHGPLCDALLEAEGCQPTDSQTRLEHLEQSNLFIVPLDNKRQWYRYHHLFRDLLRHRLQRAQGRRIPELHRRAGDWHEAHGDIREAVRHALAGAALAPQTLAAAEALIERHALTMLYRGEIKVVLDWFQALPERSTCASPTLCISHAWAMALTEHADYREAVERKLTRAEAMLADLDREPELQAWVAGHIASVRAFLLQSAAQRGGDPQELIALSRQAQELLPEREVGVKAVNALNIGYAYLTTGEVEAARAAFEEAARIGQAGGNHYVVVYAIYNQALIARHYANLEHAMQILDEGSATFAKPFERPEHGLPAAGCLDVGRGRVLLQQNRREEAERALLAGLDLLRWTGDYEVQALGYAALAQLRAFEGNAGGAQQALNQLEQAWAAGDFYAEALRVQLQMPRFDDDAGVRSAALRWAQEHGPDVEREGVPGINPWGEARHVVHLNWARIQIAQARREKGSNAKERLAQPVLAYLQQRLDAAVARGLVGRVIEIAILQALAYDVLGETEAAMDAMQRAVLQGSQERCAFIREGAVAARLLYTLTSQRVVPVHAGQILAAFPEAMTPLQVEPNATALIEPLSEREIEVLALVAEGLTNREIAQRLYLSPHTIRAHTSNIYGKLDAHNRTEAVARARVLGILPTAS